jgi:hypothetical protein
MDKNYIVNCMLTAPGLAIHGGGSALVKHANTIMCKANGIIGTPKTTADCPALSTSLGVNGAAITNIPTLKARYFTLLAAVDPTTSAVTLSWVHGEDFSEISDIGRTKYINPGNPQNNDQKKAIVGYVCIINGTASDFIPGTTLLDVALSAVVYQDAFGFTGM